jgi:hypothetical protein
LTQFVGNGLRMMPLDNQQPLLIHVKTLTATFV